MGKFILSYERYLYNDKDSLNEGWKTWLSTFMLLLNLGLVPPKIQGSNLQNKIEWVQSIPLEKIAIAKFVSLLNMEKTISLNDKELIKNKLSVFNAKNKTSISLNTVLNSVDVKEYDDGYYKWTLNISLSDDNSFNINDIQPAKYGNGVSLISDYGDFMSSKLEDSLHNVLYEYEKLTGVEISILTIPSFYGEDPEDFSRETFNKWGIGKKGADNGILIVTSMGDRKFFIKPGYGMEEMMTDYRCKRFGEKYLVPNFKSGNYNQGFRDIIQAMKEDFGNMPIEQKKAYDKKMKLERKQDVIDFFTSALEILLLLASFGAITYFIYRSIKKRKELSLKISKLKEHINNIDSDISMLIDNGDPIFNDDEVLNGLKNAIETLKNSKIKGNKISEVENLIVKYSKELSDIKNMELVISKIKNKINSIVRDLKTYNIKQKDIKTQSEKILNYINDINFKKIDLTQKTIDEYNNKFNNILKYYNHYNKLMNELHVINHSINDFDNVKRNLIRKLEEAKKIVEKLKSIGVEEQLNVSDENIVSLDEYLKLINDILMTDLSRGVELLSVLNKKVKDINDEIESPMLKYNDIMNAKKLLDNEDVEIKKRIKEIETLFIRSIINRYERRTVYNEIEKYKRSREYIKNNELDPYGEEDWGVEINMNDVIKYSNILKELLKNLDHNIAYYKNKHNKRKLDMNKKSSYTSSSNNSGYSGSGYSGSGYSSGGYDSGNNDFDFGGGSAGGGGGGGDW